MKHLNKLFLATLGLLASYTAQAQTGIGTTTPRTTLDVNGAISVAETAVVISSTTAIIPTGYSLVRLTGPAPPVTTNVVLTAAASPTPVAGQHLAIFNDTDGYIGKFAGYTIGTNETLYMLYSAGYWRAVTSPASTAGGSTPTGSGWGLTGNAGTTAGTNFLGTTDNVDVIFKRNNVLAGQLSTSNTSFGAEALLNNTGSQVTAVGYRAGRVNSGIRNTFMGMQSGYSNTTGANNLFLGVSSGYLNTTGNNNTFLGDQAGLYTINTGNNVYIGASSGTFQSGGHCNVYVGAFSGMGATGMGNSQSYNVIIGDSAGYNNQTNRNQFVGYQSGLNNTTGTYNLFSGYQSGYNTTTGNYNQFSGYQSGYSNVSGGTNMFSGYQSGYSNTGGAFNVFIGTNSGRYSTTASNNQFFGYESGVNNVTGNNNLFVGSGSGSNNITGSNNTVLGNNANVGGSGLTNATSIGNRAVVSASNSLVLGSISGTNGATANTFVGIGTTAPGYPLDVQATSSGRSGTYGYLTSSGSTGTSGSSISVSINAAGRINASEFNAFSDARLKTLQGRSDNRADLALVQQLQITNYQMKDRAQYGNRTFKKVIAQQVESIFPQAINKGTGFIPSIYAAATLRTGAAGQTLVTVPTAHHLHVGDKVRLFGDANGKVETTVLALSGDNAFAVALPQPETKLFVFGPEVADLRTVDYEALSMLNVSATQELARQVEALQAANAKLQAQADNTTKAQAELTSLKASLADKASASTLAELQTALQSLRAEVQTLRAAGTTASIK